MERESTTQMNDVSTKCRARFASMQRGAAIVETVIALPVLLLIILAAIQFGLIYEAKATLNHAGLQAARAGAVNHAESQAIRRGLALGLLPLYSPDQSVSSAISTTARISAELLADSRIRILSPTQEAFDDFSEDVDGVREIPNDRLHTRSTASGTRSGINVQDANLLRVEVTYGYELKVPLVNWFISRALLSPLRPTSLGAFEQQLLRRGRIPITSTATVRMQSAVRDSDMLVAMADIADLPRIPADSNRPQDSDPSGQEGEAEDDADDGDDSSNDANSAEHDGDADQPQPTQPDTAQPTPEVQPRDERPVGTTPGGATDPSTSPPVSEEADKKLQCKAAPAQEPPPETGTLAQIWYELKKLAGEAAEFAKGIWEGVKSQIGDTLEMVTSPIETAKGIYELVVALKNDFVGTAKMLGEAIGMDLSALVHCGSFDRGRILGENVSPAMVGKIISKLVKLGGGDLQRVLREAKRELGCASFAAGTFVQTPGGPKRIELLNVGESVLSRSETDFDDQPRAITHVFERVAPRHRQLVTEDETLSVTDEHPVWVQGWGWKPASELEAGSVIATRDGDALVIHNESVDKPLEVHNLTVEETPSYFAGLSGAWVHNSFCHVRYEASNGKNPALNRPEPNTRYYVDGRSSFQTDELGRTTDVKTVIDRDHLDSAVRNCYQQRLAGACGLDTDDGGHIIGNKLGGPGERINLVPQDMVLNRGEWRVMESEWAKAAADGKRVDVSIKVVYPEGSARPSEFVVTYSIDGGGGAVRRFTNGS